MTGEKPRGQRRFRILDDASPLRRAAERARAHELEPVTAEEIEDKMEELFPGKPKRRKPETPPTEGSQ